MSREKTPFYAVSVLYDKKRYFAVRYNKPRVVYPIERRCVFKDIRIARELLKFMQNSDFHDVRLEKVEV